MIGVNFLVDADVLSDVLDESVERVEGFGQGDRFTVYQYDRAVIIDFGDLGPCGRQFLVPHSTFEYLRNSSALHHKRE